MKKKKTKSQQLWVKRHQKDFFFSEAKRKGYRSRAAFKLLEIDKKYGLLKNINSIADLGCYPGGWCQVIIQKSARQKNIEVYGVDIKEMLPIPGVTFIKEDIKNLLSKKKKLFTSGLNMVLSDMSPNSTGNKFVDQSRSEDVCRLALNFALDNLRSNGSFVCKLIRGDYEKLFISNIEKKFRTFEFFKPEASRKSSREIYLICRGFLI